MVWIENYRLDKLRKTDMLPMFSRIVGEVINVIEDPVSSAADLAKRVDSSMASAALRVADTAYSGTCNLRNMSFIGYATAIVGLEEAKESREQAIVISLGNKFAIKIDLRDNFPTFDVFLNNSREFVHTMEIFG